MTTCTCRSDRRSSLLFDLNLLIVAAVIIALGFALVVLVPPRLDDASNGTVILAALGIGGLAFIGALLALVGAVKLAVDLEIIRRRHDAGMCRGAPSAP